MLMATPITDTSSPGQLRFKRATTGYLMFKSALSEPVHGYAAAVWDVKEANLAIKKRTEHLSEDDLQRAAQMSSFFGGGTAADESSASSSSNQLDLEQFERDAAAAKRNAADDAPQYRDTGDDDEKLERFQLERIGRRESLAPPPPSGVSFDNYLATGLHLGRDIRVEETNKSFTARVWMSEEFPLKVRIDNKWFLC
jgi:hypothetical protein